MDYNNEPILKEEYAPGRFHIKCTPIYFTNKLDQATLNDHHYFIHITRGRTLEEVKRSFPFFIQFKPTVRLVWSNTTDINTPPKIIPISHLTFGKDSTITIPSPFKDLIPSFQNSKYWQIEITSPIDDLYIMTAPKHPKIISQ